ncbi:MAG: MFS transporter [Defluviitaleaceae bacterium]|nr:MFS transporter [Defluviitaleaceae bacterium]MCL2274257.1 MFS transporter [Defluviitaleaceae bacterium]
MLLLILYLAFIGLGLPSALLGAAWPTMQTALDLPVQYAGIVAMVISGGTIFSSLMADKFTRVLRPAYVVTLGVLFMVVGLFGFSAAQAFWLMCLWAVPLGLGSGAVDAVINNYIAVNYSSRHMNWLHCFWGLGAMLGPYVMGFYLVRGMNWGYGFAAVGAALVVVLAAVVMTMKLWKKGEQKKTSKATPIGSVLKIKGVKFVMLAFFAYCAMEGTAMLWAATYLVYNRGVSANSAALFASFFFIGITAGRIAAGFVSNKLGDRRMVTLGLAVTFVGIVAVFVPFAPGWAALAGLVIIGLGNAPIFPALMHATPAHFGEENSQALVGVQMASAYTGATIVPPLFGVLAGALGAGFFAPFLGAFFALTAVMFVALIKSTGSNYERT